MKLNQNKKYRYFMYSETQRKEKTNIEKTLNRKYNPGYVIYKGKKHLYTEIVTNVANCRYADAKLVAEGNLEDLKYTHSTHDWGI